MLLAIGYALPGYLTGRGHDGARVTTWVLLGSLTFLLALLSLFAAVLVLLALPTANAFFRRRVAPQSVSARKPLRK